MELSKKPITLSDQRAMESKLMRDAQYRKELSIGYFNSLNAAITLVTANKSPTAGKKTKDQLLEEIFEIRDHFLNGYKQYRIDVLDSTGKPSIDEKVVPALDKLKKKHEDSQTGSTNGGVAQPETR